jgi:hypothetical protein
MSYSGSICNDDRSETWVDFASCRDAKSVGSFSSTGPSRCAGAEVISSCSAAPARAVSRFPSQTHRELAIGTLLSIIRQRGVPRVEFEE